MKTQRAGFVASERHAARHQPLDGLLCVFHHKARRGFVVQARAGDDRVLNVIVGGIVIGHGRGDAALRPVARAVDELLLGDQRNALAVLR